MFPSKPKLSEDVKQLIKSMLTVSVRNRISVSDALKHPWFKKYLTKSFKAVSLDEDIDNQVFNNLKKFRNRSTLRNAAINILVKHLDTSELQRLREQFEAIDTDGSGFIEIEELKEAMEKQNMKMSLDEMQQIIDKLDYANNDKINYTEFIAATLDVGQIISKDEKKLKAIFNTFDVDNTGFITR